MKPMDALMKAGRIAAKVRERTSNFVEIGMPVIKICDFVEDYIQKLGGALAFPCNVDVNFVAAHYTSPVGDFMVIPEDSLVKIDIGVHVEGFIADTATTVCFSPIHREMIEAAKAGLDAAIKKVRAGIVASEVGAAIESEIRSRGFAPITNLTGHRMSRFIVHTGQSIPNVRGRNGHTLIEGEVYAIEPFTVPHNAAGIVIDGPPSNIYLFQKKRNVRSNIAKKMLKFIQNEYKTMPFASRWVLRKFKGADCHMGFEEILKAKCIYSYPQLIERSRAPVAQAEHTVIVEDDGCLVTTA